MHTLEPHYNWRNLYTAEEDERSPFFQREYSEMYFTDAIYDHVIHPQWDNIDSNTLFIKILYAEYEEGYAMIELIGEWNDCLYNDIMTLKRNIIDLMVDEGINKFMLLGDNLMNFHASDDSYYEEWFDDIEDGWVCLINFRDYVLKEFSDTRIDQYFIYGGPMDDLAWTTYRPQQLFQHVEQMVNKRFDTGLLLEESID